MSISAQAQKPIVHNLITLWTIDMTHVGMGIIRFTTDISRDNQPIHFGGLEYMPYPAKADGFERNSQGENARPTLTLFAGSKELTSLIIAQEGLQGATVTRCRTLAKYLDDGDEPDSTQHFPIERYKINCKSQWKTGVSVVLELVNALDMENVKFPARQIVRNYCDWIYRFYDVKTSEFNYEPSNKACPYAGTKYFNSKNEPVRKELDKCSKTIEGCSARFGKNTILPYGGFPGVAPHER